MTDKLWDDIKDFYYERFGTAPELVDIAPILDILRLCASGSSNKAIATFFNETEEGLMELFDAHLGFMGWEVDLPFSPLRIYKELENKDIKLFYEKLVQSIKYLPSWINVENMYKSAEMVEKLERLFDEKWI